MADQGSTGGFPEVVWGRPDTRAAEAGRWLVGTRAGSWLVRGLVPLDRWVLTRSKGRFTALGPFGTPLLLLTTTGARTGLTRTTPLVYLHDGDRLLLAGSNFGRSSHPSWSANLLADPEATVTIGGRAVPVRARRLEGAERAQGWTKFCDAARPYRVYGTRTDRSIRVFSLQRQAEETA